MSGAAESVVGALASELGIADKLFVATKVWTSGRAAGIRQMEDSLRKLGADRLDLMQVHNLLDADTHLATLAAWRKEGRVRYVGITHYHAGAHAALEAAIRKHRPEFVQLNYSLAEREAERRLLGVAAGEGVAVIVNRPTAAGAMFARVRGKPLPDWAREIDCSSWTQFFLKFVRVIRHRVIPGTRNANTSPAATTAPARPCSRRIAVPSNRLGRRPGNILRRAPGAWPRRCLLIRLFPARQRRFAAAPSSLERCVSPAWR
jgi:diketogulonate reductase-like aldo/keto reductase